MAYKKIDERFWKDEKVMKWDTDTTLLALYLLTNPHSTFEGLYQLKKLYMMADLEWSEKRLEDAFRQLLEDDFLRYDEQNYIVFLPNALKYNPPKNPNQAKSAINQLKKLPKTSLIKVFLERAKKLESKIIEVLEDPSYDIGYNSLPNPPGSVSEHTNSNSSSKSNTSTSSKSKSNSKNNIVKSAEDKYNDSAPTTNNGLDYKAIKKEWNRRVPKDLQIRAMTQKRKEKLRTRYKEENFDLDEIVDALQEQPFCLGDNDRGWVADFTWLIKNGENYVKVLEHRYGDKGETDEERLGRVTDRIDGK